MRKDLDTQYVMGDYVSTHTHTYIRTRPHTLLLRENYFDPKLNFSQLLFKHMRFSVDFPFKGKEKKKLKVDTLAYHEPLFM